MPYPVDIKGILADLERESVLGLSLRRLGRHDEADLAQIHCGFVWALVAAFEPEKALELTPDDVRVLGGVK